MLSLFKKFKDGLTKTVSAIAAKTHGLFGGRKIDAVSLGELEEALYTADFGVETTTEILEEIKTACRSDAALQGQQAAAIGAAVLRRVLAGAEGKLEGGARPPGGLGSENAPGGRVPPGNPTVICLIGVNGSGKTTTTAKLAHKLKGDGQSVMVAACDTFRAAAVEQLRSWTERLGIDLIASHSGADAAAVAFDAWQAAKARGKDWLIVDTAGRLHTKTNLMAELEKMRRTAAKVIPAAPHEVLLVLDATTGQNGLEQARRFTETSGVTGIVLTKLDGTAKGGIVIAIARELNLPIRYIGVGEKVDDLLPFEPEQFVASLFE
jgi:fused signal recognition particle receptor